MSPADFVLEIVRRELEPLGVEVVVESPTVNFAADPPSTRRHVIASLQPTLGDKNGRDAVLTLRRRVSTAEYYCAAYVGLTYRPSAIAAAAVEMLHALDVKAKRDRKNDLARLRRLKPSKKRKK